jgi:hypothetical protein
MLIFSENAPLKGISVLLALASFPFAAIAATRTELRALLVPFCFLSAVGSSWYALEFRATRLVFELPFFAYLSFSLYLILAKNYGAAEFDNFFGGIGRNGFSAILVAMTAGYLISRLSLGKEPSLVVLAAALLASVPMFGRSSIASLAALFVACALLRRPKWTLLIVAGLAILSIAYLWVAAEAIDLLQRSTNFKEGLISDRWQMLGQYIDALTPYTLLTGVDMRDLPAVVENDGSPDMAFLRLHSFLGVSSFFFFVVISYSALKLLRSRQLLLLALLITVLFRSFTDVILMFGTVDLFFLPVLLFPFYACYWKPSAAAVDNEAHCQQPVALG